MSPPSARCQVELELQWQMPPKRLCAQCSAQSRAAYTKLGLGSCFFYGSVFSSGLFWTRASVPLTEDASRTGRSGPGWCGTGSEPCLQETGQRCLKLPGLLQGSFGAIAGAQGTTTGTSPMWRTKRFARQ